MMDRECCGLNIKVVMNSGKEYTVEKSGYSVQDFVNSFYNEIKNPMGQTHKVMKNSFMYLDDEQNVSFNPSHVSSIEILE